MSLGQFLSNWMETLIALCALLISLVVALWTIYRDWRIKGNIKISVFLRTYELPDESSAYMTFRQKKGLYLYVNAVNVGQRPINLLGGGLVFKKEQDDGTKEIIFSFANNATQMLEEARLFTHEIPVNGFALSEIKIIYLKDTFGKDWKLSNRNLKSIQREEQEALHKKDR